MKLIRINILMLFIVVAFQTTAQITITGKVIDAASGDPVPFANVVFKNTSIGATTNFDGKYTITTKLATDTLVASYIGYKTKSKAVSQSNNQTINFQLEEDVVSLQEVVVQAGENPAFEILRNVVKNKNDNDKRKLEAYEHDTYTKIELDVDNISDKFKKRKVMQKITQVMDSVEQIAGEDGKPILPVFISESISKIYYRKNPKLKKEHIIKTKVTGLGVEDGSFSSQYIGSSFQEYNFYRNWLNIATKEFVSPISDGWRIYYEFDLTDSLDINGHYCYRIDFFPKSEQDLAFTGTMWITKKEYALKQIDVTVGKSANLNYIEKIKIQQELVPTTQGAWIPSKNRVLLDIGEITNKTAGMLAKFYTSNQNVIVNQLKEPSFYETPIVLSEDYRIGSDDAYWEKMRHEPLSDAELNVYSMIDTLVNIPVVKTYTEIIQIAIEGYYSAGKIDIGPYSSIYANNTVEGHRFQMGFKTNYDLSPKWVFGGRVAYGTNDNEFKYRAFVDHIFSRNKWTKLQLSYTRDLDLFGLSEVDLLNNSVFLTASRFGTLQKPYYYNEARLQFQREFFKGFTQKLTLRNRQFEPIESDQFRFAYYTDMDDITSPIATNFTTTEVVLESRYAKSEVYLQAENSRLVVKQGKWPVFTIRYTIGLKEVLKSNFDYQKLTFNVQQNLIMGFFGTSKISLTGERIFSRLPYPLLKVHIGNQSPFYTTAAYNLMNYSEFASDRYITLKYNHHFEGFILNRIPLMKKLKWRLLASANVLYGDMSLQNRNVIPEFNSEGFEITQPGYLSPVTPYIELGYGVENIFKIIRVDAIHRLNYLDNPEASDFGVKVSLQFIL